MYKLIKTLDGVESGAVVKANEDNSLTTIPPVADNTDYQAYLAWVAEGNTPEPSDD
ncbi:hypothetical protein UFOVP160_25 [uncultured Caudovirales phage]|uniref:Uncharacterized protein n=1 Tax=uncultured Caudovirales phage TaxID=2100421 RepID=A0A6J7WH30_9CAUD|nr:hypothetical protein UFOVP160_25 [uncultured Caudovirales phage]